MEALLQQREALLRDWQAALYAPYSPEMVRTLTAEGEGFANPVGSTFTQSLQALLDALLTDAEDDALSEPLAALLRIRSVQQLSPSTALSFVVELKTLVRQTLGERATEPGVAAELAEFDRRADRLLALALDTYVQLREETYRLKVRDIQRQVGLLLRRSGVSQDLWEASAES